MFEERAIRGVPWTFLAYGGSRVITLAAIIVLAHLLSAEDFGLFSLALLAVGVLFIIRSLGLGATLVVRQDRDDPAWFGTVLSLSVLSGVAIAALTAAASPLVAALLDEPQLTALISVLSLMSAFGAVGQFYDSYLQRQLEFRKRFLGYLLQSVAFAVVSISLAVAGAGVWSLVVGQVASIGGHAVSLWAVSSLRVRPAFDRGAVREAFGTGRGFLLQGGIAYVQQNVDYVAVGAILGPKSLGFYSMAYRLAEVPNLAIADPIAKVTFPGFARMVQRGEDAGSAFLATLKVVGLVAFPFGILLSAIADPFTRALFDDEWLPMIGPLMLLGLWAAARTIEVTLGWFLNSTGYALTTGTVAGVLTIPTVPLLILAAEGGDLSVVAAVVLGHNLLFLAVLAAFIHNRLRVPLREQLAALRATLVATPATWLAAWGVGEATASLHPILGLAAAIAAGVGAFAAAVSLVERSALRYVTRQARRALAREPA